MPGVVEIVGIVSGVGGLALSSWPYIREPLSRGYERLRKPLAENYSYLRDFARSSEMLHDIYSDYQTLRQDSILYHCKWIKDGKNIMDDHEDLLQEVFSARKFAQSWNFRKRIRLAKRVQDKVKAMESLLEKGKLELLAARATTVNPIYGEAKPFRPLVGSEAFVAVKDIFEYLNEHDDIRIVGVCGPSGIGKTAVMRIVHSRALLEINSFSRVIWVDVHGVSDDVLTIQRRLAREIPLDLSHQNDARRNSEELLAALSNSRKVLLIVDGMCKALPLEEIGIPRPAPGNRLKVAVVSRFASVCDGMGVDKLVDLKLVSSETAWELFLDELVKGRISKVLPEAIEPVVKDVVKASGTLPLEIILVARALRKVSDDFPEWEDSLSSLRRHLRTSMSEEEKTLARLRFCYDSLPDPHSKLCFLYVALFPEYNFIEVEELIGYWIWEGLLGDVEWVDVKIKHAKETLDTLVKAGLLDSTLDGELEWVTMPPLVREMAISIMTEIERPTFLPKYGLESELDWPRDAVGVSLIERGVKDLSNKPAHCPNLSSLLMQYNPLNGKVRDDFFCVTPNLLVLNLSYSGINLLPVSLVRLTKLRALFLRGCAKLRRLPNLSELSELLVLDLTDTQILELPNGIQNLTKLKRLALNRTHHLVFPPGLLQAFRDCLQELLVDICGFLWQSRSSNMSREMAYADELTLLPNLRTAEVNFASAQAYQEYLISGHLGQLKRFKFSIGGWCDGRSLKKYCMGVIGGLVTDDSNLIPLPNYLLELHVVECHDINHLGSQGLSYLKTLVVADCSKLECLFQVTELQKLKFLEKITVKRCQNIALLFKPEEAGNDNPKKQISLSTPLQKLILVDLPRLELIFDGKLSCDSLGLVTIWKCDNLKDIPFSNFMWQREQLSVGALRVFADRGWYDAMSSAGKEYKWDRYKFKIGGPPISPMAYRSRFQPHHKRTASEYLEHHETKEEKEISKSSEIYPVGT